MMKRTSALLMVGLVGCSSSGIDAQNGSPPSSGASDAGAGGVSFGGQQDIGEFRGILGSGGVPGADTLDANGFFNEHYAAPPANACADTMCMTPGLSVGHDWVTGVHQAALQIAINTNVDPANYPKLPLDLTVVIDHSGSMASDGRLDKVKSGLNTLIDTLGETDRLAIVEFDNTVRTDATFTTTLDRAHLHTIVAGLVPAGGTDIFRGLQTGFDLAAATLAPTRQHRVILLSDGLATSGNTDTTAILAMADGYVERGIGLTTIGVGADFDVNLMRGLAEHGAGNFYFLENPNAATEVFQQELDFFATPLALDISISGFAGTGYNFGEVVGSSLWAGNTRGGAMHIPAAFVASRTSVSPDPTTGGRRGGGSMLFIHIDPTANNTDGTVADLTLSYREPSSGTIKTQNVHLTYALDPTQTPDEVYLSAPEMAPRFAMYNMFLGFRAAVTETNYNCAVVSLRALKAAATAWNVTHENPDIVADLKLVDEYIVNLGAHGASLADGLDATSCRNTGYGAGADGGWGGYGSGYPSGGDEIDGCAASRGTAGGFVLVLMIGGVLRRARRKSR